MNYWIKIALTSISVALFVLQAGAQTASTALVSGKWFDGKGFKTRTMYSVDGRFVSKRPKNVGKTIDLAGLWVIPPLAEAHNHSIATGVTDWDKKAVSDFIRDGVYYVKIQGNLPISAEDARSLGVNNGSGPDVIFSQGAITASGGHPIGLIENVLLKRGYFPGYTKDTLKDHRYFTIDSEADLEKKWPAIIEMKRDFLKVMLWAADEHDMRAASPKFMFQRALDPKLLPLIVSRSHAAGLRVSAHVTTAADFRIAVESGVDEISHLPYLGSEPISAADAKLAAKKGIVVVTTAKLITWIPKNALPDSERPGVEKAQIANLKMLLDNKVKVAIGSDNTSDTSVAEIEYLRGLNVFNDRTLLKMWTETTPRAIFPDRKIGKLANGYEASFLALEADPLADLMNVKKIKYRFKKGLLLEPAPAGK
ncbi:MAG: amidohydrolase family protein [Pyrinomonadaceae bacterium]|nr:amidohydrolase family protein [Pyrinomonadaceae bacterium]